MSSDQSTLGAAVTALNEKYSRKLADHSVQFKRRGLRIRDLEALEACVKDKRSVIIRNWPVGPRPAVFVYNMIANCVHHYLKTGMYIYRAKKK